MQAQAIATKPTYTRQAKNDQFANDGSLKSVERLVEKMTFKFFGRVAKLGLGMTEDDVRQEILMAYVKAKNAWNPEGGARFSTYFQTTAQNEFNRRIERQVADRTTMGMVNYTDLMVRSVDDEGDPLEFIGGEETEDGPEMALERREEFLERMRGLSEGARKLMLALINDERQRSANKPPRLRDIATRMQMPLDEIKQVKLELFNRFGTTFV